MASIHETLTEGGADDGLGAAPGRLWALLGVVVVAAHLLMSSTEDAELGAAVTQLRAAWSATAYVAAALAASCLARRGPTLVGPACAALALVAALWLRAGVVPLEAPPADDQPRPRALAPVQRLQVVSGTRLLRDGYAVQARWRASCGLQAGSAPRCQPRSGVVDVALPESAPLLPPGSEVRVHGWVHPDATPRNPGFARAHAAVALRGVRGRIRVANGSAVALEQPAPWPVAGWVDATRLQLRRRLRAELGADVAALVCGLGLGDRSAVRPELLDALRATGTSHVLAVSGTHVGVVVGLAAALLGVFLGFLAPDLLRRFPRDVWLVAPLTCVAWGYTLLAGAPASACRAATMVTVALVWRGLLRRPQLMEAVGFAIVALVLMEPWALADLGLALSICGVLGAVLGASRALTLGTPAHRALAAVVGLLGASIGAFATTAAPGLPVFGALPLAAPLVNLLVVPLVSLWLLPLSLLATALAALPAHGLTDGALDAVGTLIEWGSKPLDLLVAVPETVWPWLRPPPALAQLVGLAIAPSLWALSTPLRLSSWRARWTRWAGGVAICACALSPLWPAPRAAPGTVDVWMFDVGHGDATLLRFADGTTMLVDAGGEVGDDGRVGRRAVVPALRALDVRRVDVMVVSHPHPDHENGLLAVARAFPVREFWSNGQPSAGAEHRALRALLRERGTTMRTLGADSQRRWGFGGASVELVWPSPARAPWDPTLGANDNSLVLVVRTAGASLLLAGDIEGPAERALLAEGRLPRNIDVLKVPHHGSRTSSSVALLSWLRPGLAMAGARPWGVLPFPDPDVRARYAEMGIPLWATAEGAVQVQLGPDGWSARQAARWLRRRNHPAARPQAAQVSADSLEPRHQPGGSHAN